MPKLLLLQELRDCTCDGNVEDDDDANDDLMMMMMTVVVVVVVMSLICAKAEGLHKLGKSGHPRDIS